MQFGDLTETIKRFLCFFHKKRNVIKFILDILEVT